MDVTTLTLKQAKRVIVLVVGITLLLMGIAMILLPGPAILFIPLSLAILGTEFLWARQLLKTLKERTIQMRDRMMKRSNKI